MKMICVDKIAVEWKISLNLYNYIYGKLPEKDSSESYFYFKYAEQGFGRYSIEESSINKFFYKIKQMILLSNSIFNIKINPFIISKKDAVYGCFINNFYDDGYFIGFSLNSFYRNEYILEETFLHELVHLLLEKTDNKSSFLITLVKDGVDLKESEEVICDLLSSEKIKKQNRNYYNNTAILFDEYRKDNVCWDDFSIKIKNL